MRHVEQSTFDFRSGIIRAEIMGMTGHAPQFEAERGLTITAQDAPYAAMPRSDWTWTLSDLAVFFPIHTAMLRPRSGTSRHLAACLHGDSGPPSAKMTGGFARMGG